MLSVNFIKFFRNEDQKVHQNSGIEESQVDMLKSLVTLETYNSIGKDEPKNSCQNTRTLAATDCPIEMDVDSEMSSENNDVENCTDQMPSSEADAMDSHCYTNLVGANLSSEVSAIYLAMQHSKLECVDEPSQDSISTEVSVEADDSVEIDDFDPYLFIKNLPELSSVVPTFRPMLLPKQTRSCPPTTLVLDLDGKNSYVCLHFFTFYGSTFCWIKL